ncbi:hypothetical protein JA33_065 [Dickeya phage vB_DsoM_JA33]|uniref:Uncharacterized protein n=2 Tax=Salmondvirus JA11 TaxID=2734141 RepID=A0A386K599_9CAUD|nr:hypothetical protein HOU32_gp065 [Dickeya phage vB_DsoM_JA11]AXG67439.1 hypothetical protein JA33_065 [Dickeya phage vB_DsoM_JA33]AYD79870.1 hypothetical protein JA11_065 [Dickeya phage vB_DsoM_JA11]
MSLASKIGSDEMEVEHKNNVTRLAKEMANGRMMMPRSKIDYKDLIKVELDSSKNIITEHLLTARASIPLGNGLMYVSSHNCSAKMLEGFCTYGEGVAHVIEEAVDSAEVLINNAIGEAREILRSTLYVPPLFLLATDKKSVKSLYSWLTENTEIDEGIVAGIISITEMNPNGTSYLRISNGKVESMDSTEFALSLSTHFNFTAILNFVSSYDTKNIPCMDEVIKYHKHVSIAKRY